MNTEEGRPPAPLFNWEEVKWQEGSGSLPYALRAVLTMTNIS